MPRTSSRRPLVAGVAFSFMLVAVTLAGVFAGKAYGREGGQVTPTIIPATAGGHARVQARAVCPNDSSIPACRAALRRAYAALAWQKHARAMTVRDITRDAITWAAAKYHVSARDMTSVAACESHLWPFATNGQYKGVWQLGARHREDPIFRLVPWQDAYAQASHVARYVRAHGFGEWQCQPGGGLRW